MLLRPSFLTLALLSCCGLAADVRLPSLFSDHMVLQSGMAVPVWGWADAGETVSVSIAGQTQTATTGADGKWRLTLGKLEAAENAVMTAKGKNTISISDVSIGEVWLGSGQSNMQMQVNASNNPAGEKAKASFPQIRMFQVSRVASPTPQDKCGGAWVVCTPETVGEFSAALYFFGRELHQSLKTPVGLINSSWGGTSIESWTSMEAMKGVPEAAGTLAEWGKKVAQPYDEAKAKAFYEKQLATWKTAVEKAKADGKPAPQKPRAPVAPQLDPNNPANLFNGMIQPILPYAIKGAVWYQGEHNARLQTAKNYAVQLPLLIADWRKRWGQGDFPFAWVQLPNYMKRSDNPGARSGWALMRESMLKSLSTPNTGMAVAIDVGSADNIHPQNKQAVGYRLSLWARDKVYGQKLLSAAPLPSGHKVKGGELTVFFPHVEGGLKAREGQEVTGFALAGADKKWFWAKARIEGDFVVVSCPEVSAPVAVRYAWGDNPDCNLVTANGLPVSPFRTDDWD